MYQIYQGRGFRAIMKTLPATSHFFIFSDFLSKQLFNKLIQDRFLSEIINQSNIPQLVGIIQMERLRIRSMINQIKMHQASAPLRRKQVQEGSQNSHHLIIQNGQQKSNLNHSCFILKTIDEVSFFQQPEVTNQAKRGSVTSAKQKQSRSKIRKITNHCYLTTINPKSKDQFENLSELGIQTKKINGRNIRKTEANVKIDSQKINLFSQNQVVTKRQRKMYQKPPIVEYLNRKKSLPDKRMTIIFEDVTGQKLIKSKFPEVQKQTIEARSSRFAKIKGLTINIPKTSRKNSDISPWQFESPLIKA